jgi:hypothetical protein
MKKRNAKNTGDLPPLKNTGDLPPLKNPAKKEP